MNVARNTIPRSAIVPATPAEVIIPPAASFVEPADADDNAPPRTAGDVFAALLLPPEAERTAHPASNDDIAEDGSSDDAPARRIRSDANCKLRRIVGPRLFRARELSGYSQTEAATALGYASSSQLNQWEAGRRLAPIFEVIKAARLYGVSVDYLLGESHEPDRDPSAGARRAILRGVRGMLSKMAELTVGEIDRHARLIGPHASNVRGLIDSGDATLEALGAFVRHNHDEFVNMRGSASLQRLSTEFEVALDEARAAIRLHDARDADLARVLADLADGDIAIDEDA